MQAANHAQNAPSDSEQARLQTLAQVPNQVEEQVQDRSQGEIKKPAEGQKPAQVSNKSGPPKQPQVKPQTQHHQPQPSTPQGTVESKFISALAAGIADAMSTRASNAQETRELVRKIGEGMGHDLIDELGKCGVDSDEARDVAEAWTHGVFKGMWFRGGE